MVRRAALMPADDPTSTVLYLHRPFRRLRCRLIRICQRSITARKNAMTGAVISAVRGRSRLSVNDRLQYNRTVSSEALMIFAYSS